MRTLPRLSFTLLVSILATACALPSLDVQPRYERLSISGTGSVSSGGTGGAADLGQAGLDSDDTFGGRVDFKFGSPHLIALAQSPRFQGSGTLDVTVSDGTNTITSGADVDSDVALDQYDLALVFDLVPTDLVEVGIGVGAAYLDGSLSFIEQGTGTEVSSSEQVPIPLAVGVASVWLGPVQVAAFVGGMQYTYQGDRVRYVDADVYARWKVFGGHELLRTSLVVGYRRTDFELDYADASAQVGSDLTIDGVYFGLEVGL